TAPPHPLESHPSPSDWRTERPGIRQSRAPATPGSGTYRPQTTQNGPHPRRTPENADYRPADRTPEQRTSASHPQPDPDTPDTSPAVTRHEEPPENHHR